MDDATKIIDPGTPEYPLDPTLAAEAEACPHCETTIPPGEQFCPRCGFQRGSLAEDAEPAVAAVAADEGDSKTELADAPWLLRAADGTEYPLPLGDTKAGRGEVAIQLSDSYVSRVHGRFAVTDEGVLFADLGSSNGSFLGVAQLQAQVETKLEDGDVIRLGQTDLTLVRCEVEVAAEQVETMAEAEPGPAAEATSAEEAPGLEEAEVMVEPAESQWSLTREGVAEVIHLRFGETKLGRKLDQCDQVILGDGYISGCHAKLIVSETTLEVIDLGSTNGTFLAEEQLKPDELTRLGPGDVLRLGETKLTVEYNELGDAESEVEEAAE